MPKPSKHTSTLAANFVISGVIIGVLVFCTGALLIFFTTIWLGDNFDVSSKFISTLSNIAILALIVFALALTIGIPMVLIANYNRDVEKKLRSIQIANIDSMTGIEFEQYLKELLTNQGYSVSLTNVSGDLGVDLVALKSGNTIAIQVKRYNTKVSRRAVSDAVAGMQHYGCNKAMVITNNYFSPGAVTLAKSTGCTLVDRDMLAKWVNEFQNIGSTTT